MSYVTRFISGKHQADFLLDYAASKGGLTGMMKNLSTRLAEFNISVNDVAPAMIGDTGMIPSAAAIPDVAAGENRIHDGSKPLAGWRVEISNRPNIRKKILGRTV